MKKALLIIGIVIIVAGVLGLLWGALFKYISMNTLDGSVDLYIRQRKVMFAHLISGTIALVLGIVCLIVRGKIG